MLPTDGTKQAHSISRRKAAYDQSHVNLPEAIAKALLASQKLKASGAANEANTKALMIEPLLDALGWDTTDLDAVDREVKVYDGTFLDYGLKANGAARLYVEAKAIGENLSDKKFTAQAVNYANNDGVVWCVLTNGLLWRVFKTNESAEMDKKLLFEVEISDETQPVADVAKLLRLIGRQSVAEGALDRYGERVFTDGRVRAALAAVALDPPPALIDVLKTHLGHPSVSDDALRRSLARILDAPLPSEKLPTGTTLPSGPAAGPPQPPQPAKGQEYSLEHHLGNKSALIEELYTAVNSFGTALGGDVTRRIRKQYIGYFRGKKSFFTVELQKQRVLIYLSLAVAGAQPWNPDAMRDVKRIGHFGMGDVEYSLASTEHLEEATALIKQAYEASASSAAD